MNREDDQDRRRRQIERLLGFPGVGALDAAAIAVNLGVPAGSLDALLVELTDAGRIVTTEDGRFTLPSVEGRH